ncbi:MAG: PorV/PorQ family protein [Elusimicrobia bacterium]|nr:PorV/PorQ family protein [Elusimicrobiota bacterium]
MKRVTSVQCPKSNVRGLKSLIFNLKSSIFFFLLSSCLLLLASSNTSASFNKASVGTSGAQFLKLGAGAKYIGLGGVGVVGSGDASVIYWNEAGLTGLDRPAISIMHSMWLADIGYSYVGYEHPVTGIGVIGIGVQYLNYGTIKGADENGVEESSFSPSDTSTTLSYGNKLNEDLSIGVGIKYISSKIKNSGSAIAGDLGLLYKQSDSNLSIGLAMQNVGGKIKYEDQADNLPMVVRLGFGYEVMDALLLVGGIEASNDKAINVAIGGMGSEYTYRVNEDTNIVGRLGYNAKTKDIGGLKGLSLGSGVGYKGYQLDYAFVPFGNLGDTHQVSMNVKF